VTLYTQLKTVRSEEDVKDAYSTDVRTVRDQYKLNRADVGWYQVRNALKARNVSGDTAPVNHGPFELAYQALTEKLQPQVFNLGFLR
jgi:hypothetical protein